jgi:RHS repeat-associated protein
MFSRPAPATTYIHAEAEEGGGGEGGWLFALFAALALAALVLPGVASGAAGRLLERDFGGVLAGASGNPAVSVARSGRVVRYLSDYRALVRGRRGLEVVRSSVPLRVVGRGGVRRPVDLRLVGGAGGFAAVRPLVGVSIAGDSGGGVAVGGDGLRVVPEGASVPGGLVGGRDVFFGGVGRDMDGVVAPVLGGVELFSVLRSRLSAEEIRYRLALPLGAVLRAAGGGAVVSRGGVVLARVPAPVARDARGRRVGVRMEVDGDELVLRVAHRERDVAYPVLVDPSVITITEKSEGWGFTKMFRGCGEEAAVSGKAPGGGSSLVLEAPLTEYPRPEMMFCKEEPRNYQIAWGLWTWKGPVYFTSVEFSGMSLAETTEPEDTTAVAWTLSACEATRFGLNGEALPSSVLLEHPKCKATGSNSVGVELVVGEVKHEQPVAVSATMSVGAILLHEAWVLPSESETYGPVTPGEPFRTRCELGHPVDCATGNQVESQTDLHVGGRGMGLDLTRTYNSRLAAKLGSHGVWGYGWAGPYSAHVTTEKVVFGLGVQEVAMVYQDNGSAVRFERGSAEEPWSPAGPLVQATLTGSGGGYVYTLPSQSKLTFDGSGRLSSEADRNGNTMTMTRNGEGRLESVTDPAGRKMAFAYNAEGLTESAKDPLGHTVKYTYEAGNLASVTEPGEGSPRWRFKYDKAHELTGETDGRGNTVTTEYDSSHRVSAQTDPLKRTRKWEYVGVAGVEDTETLITEPNGSVTRDAFNMQELPTSVTHAWGTPEAATVGYEYDALFNVIAVKDPNTHETTYTYNTLGDRTSETDPDGNQTKWAYDGTHDLTATTTPNGETTTITRDTHGNAESVSRPAPGNQTQTTSYQYDGSGNVKSMTDPLKHIWSYEYNSQGDRTGETDPEGNRRTHGYDEDSRETSMVSPAGNVKGAEPAQYTTKIERDSQGRPISIADPLGHMSKYAYDADGNLETQTDPNGHTTTFVYDADEERTATKEPDAASTETGYDAMGRVTSQTDGNKHTTTYTRNNLGEITEAKDPLGRVTKKEYDPAGNLTTLTDPAKRATTYAYDPADRLTQISYSDKKTPAVKYEYDPDGNRTTMTDGTGSTTYTYDLLDRLVQNTSGHGDTTGYEYDLAGGQTKLAYPGNKLITRAYDNTGRLKSVTDWSKNTTTFTYDPDSNLTQTTLPTSTGQQDKTTYNHADQIMKITMGISGVKALASLAYTRDNDGQVKTTTTIGLPGEEKASIVYDANNRLTSATPTSYEYDPANNPTKIAGTTNTYDAANELESSGATTYAYDQLGERTSRTPKPGQTTTYGYDQAGNLTQVKQGKTGGLNVNYAYNGDGLRTSQTKGTTTSFLTWDTHAGLPLVLKDEQNTYIYGPDNLPIEQISTKTGLPTYLHHDQQGSTRLLTGTTGKPEATITYDAYGNTTTSQGTTTTPLGYDAQYTTPDTGLIYLHARTYDPTTAQFLTVDPLTMTTREPYAYAGDNPINNADRTGLASAFEEELPEGAPCIFPACLPSSVRESLETGVQTVEELGENLVDAITGHEAANDEGEQVLKERQAKEAECGEEARAKQLRREGEELLGGRSERHSKAAGERWQEWYDNLGKGDRRLYRKVRGPRARSRN